MKMMIGMFFVLVILLVIGVEVQYIVGLNGMYWIIQLVFDDVWICVGCFGVWNCDRMIKVQVGIYFEILEFIDLS